jgi:hypothetical protein
MSHWLTKQMPVYKVYLAWLASLSFLCVIGLALHPSFALGKKAQLIKTGFVEP